MKVARIMPAVMPSVHMPELSGDETMSCAHGGNSLLGHRDLRSEPATTRLFLAQFRVTGNLGGRLGAERDVRRSREGHALSAENLVGEERGTLNNAGSELGDERVEQSRQSGAS